MMDERQFHEKHGAHPKGVNYEGETPSQCARRLGWEDVAQLIIRYGSDLEETGREGLIPRQFHDE